MKIYVVYDRNVDWKRKQLDTALLLYQGDMSPSGNAYVFEVKTLSDLGYVLETGKALYVLREPMELGTFTKLEDVTFNVDYVINSSRILFIDEGDGQWRPMDREGVTVDLYLEKEEQEKRLRKLANVGKPR